MVLCSTALKLTALLERASWLTNVTFCCVMMDAKAASVQCIATLSDYHTAVFFSLWQDKVVKQQQSLNTATANVTEVQINWALFLLWSPSFADNLLPQLVALYISFHPFDVYVLFTYLFKLLL